MRGESENSGLKQKDGEDKNKRMAWIKAFSKKSGKFFDGSEDFSDHDLYDDEGLPI